MYKMDTQIIEKIKKEHTRVDVELLKKVYAALEEIFSRKKDTTITAIAEKTHIKRSKVARAMTWLVRYNLAKKKGKGSRIVFFKVIPQIEKVYFVFGEKNVDLIINSNLKVLKEYLASADYKELTKLRETNFSKFLAKQNMLIDTEWKRNNKNSELKKIEFATKAIRYEPR